ncbi:MAG: stage II sporulation protein P [Clostridia bacterium]|nr:stage II sporulation protein P [Clostridia bacterium]
MVRIHVIRASHLLLGVAAVVLITVLLIVAFGSRSEGAGAKEKDLRQTVWEAEAVNVSASAIFAPTTDEEIRVEIMKADKEDIRVLIYHTHTHEAYEKKETDAYVETSAWRTKNNQYNIVRVGEELARLLTERGFTVIHDTTDHELSDLSTAYTRSLATMEKYTDNIDVFIDLHRDAYYKDSSGNPFSLKTNEGDFARLMCLVGNGKGFDDEMHYTENYTLATLLTGEINKAVTGLCRPVMVKDGRYNQHISEKCLLIEVGHNQNSIEQALSAMPYLADALEKVLTEI